MINCFYKYRPLAEDINSKHIHQYTLNLLQKGELYFSSPKEFNDPFDGIIEYEEKITTRDIESLGLRVGVNQEYLQSLISKYICNPQKLIEIYQNKILEFQNNNKLRILCLSKTELSPLLWSHYAAYHTGICVGFRAHKLNEKSYGIKIKPGYMDKNLLLPEFPDMMIPFPIKYTDKVPQKYHFGKGNDEALKQSFTCKSKEWSYEKEVRVVAIESPSFRNPVIIDVNEIEEIIFGLRTNIELIQQVIDIISKFPYKQPGPKLFQCKRIPGTYSLEKILI